MVTAEAIAKETLFPYLEKDPGFQKEQEGIWNVFLKGLAGYEQDPKPVFAAIYRLNLYDPEKLIQRLPVIYERFIEGLAEQYVLGNKGVIREFPWLQKGLFRKKVEFFIDLKSAMTKVERESMKKDMPLAYSALSGEITEEEIRTVIAKTEREDLKKKFTKWDREMKEEKHVFRSFSHSLDYNSYIPSKKVVEREEREETLLLPEKATPARKSDSYVWILVVVVLLVAGFFLWLLL